MKLNRCPGAAAISGTPELNLKECPSCGAEIEIFTNEQDTVCPSCGRVIYNDILSCVKWCDLAVDCVGEEKFNAMMGGQKEE